MLLYSTKNKALKVDLKEAVMKGLPDDNGLFMPYNISKLDKSFFNSLEDLSFQEIAYTISNTLLNGFIPESVLKNIIEESINFPAPVIALDSEKYILELFHGPTLAFKDFGARFMAQLMGYFNQSEQNDLVILVATSGDTGGAVASGFYKTPGIKVVILYPSGKVSQLQEKQLTTLGENITALEINGTFDDCQKMVKTAFLDKSLNKELRLSSANSINIARLIPQSFYYFEAFKQIPRQGKEIVFSVPSGNFGNLTAGLIAKKMGLPVSKFIAATNINHIVPTYLESNKYQPKPSIATISNAMDVGNPSNFARIIDLYSSGNGQKSSTWNIIKEEIRGYWYDDKKTKKGIEEVYNKYNYIIDPHGAIGYLALKEFQESTTNTVGIILETAHPSKFKNTVIESINNDFDIPERLNKLANIEGRSVNMEANFNSLKSYLLSKQL